MSEILRSVGLDVGTTSTQLIVSRLTVENRASSFALPEMEIARREILYKSRVYFTPLLDESHVDASALRSLVEREYAMAGLKRDDVDTGAIIITGETSRKENARAVLEALADFAGDFVVATAGPDLESVLAAKGSGAVDYSERTGKTVIHMDIGGGTSNLALIEGGKIIRTTCLNVGGRLVKYDETKSVTYVSPVLRGLCSIKIGDRISPEFLRPVTEMLVQALEMAVGLRVPGPLLDQLTTEETVFPWEIPGEGAVISFSGGVADCIAEEQTWDAYGDLGPVLGQTIRRSGLCAGEFVLGQETIRATVIGAGCHSAQLSGSTVFCQNISFPLKNVPVVQVRKPSREEIRRALRTQEETALLALRGINAPSYRQVREMAEELLAGTGEKQILVCLEADMAKALGQALAVRMDSNARILCLDRVKAGDGCYLDIGAPVGPALPVVVKTLILSK